MGVSDAILSIFYTFSSISPMGGNKMDFDLFHLSIGDISVTFLKCISMSIHTSRTNGNLKVHLKKFLPIDRWPDIKIKLWRAKREKIFLFKD